ncbi:MAG: indole-3-glycerol-phosphate synthase [Candidatus Eremiobacteraeota bacterium]|nr:indole-3-glycerol-phosphate synthase [Candidatus Eremiobacteraeota bacterium]
MTEQIAHEPLDVLRLRARRRQAGRRSFRQALMRAATGIIGEIKIASPSRGRLIDNARPPASIARAFEAAGIDAISVVTEEDFFHGNLALLSKIRRDTRLPVLRKDFLTTPYEIVQSAAHGADAVLLITAGLADDQLQPLLSEALEYDLDVVLEIHDEQELVRALTFDPSIVGVNNRNLRTFEVSLNVSKRLINRIPRHILAISESGLRSPTDVIAMKQAGARACLIGEALLGADDPRAFIAACRPAFVA